MSLLSPGDPGRLPGGSGMILTGGDRIFIGRNEKVEEESGHHKDRESDTFKKCQGTVSCPAWWENNLHVEKCEEKETCKGVEGPGSQAGLSDQKVHTEKCLKQQSLGPQTCPSAVEGLNRISRSVSTDLPSSRGRGQANDLGFSLSLRPRGRSKKTP